MTELMLCLGALFQSTKINVWIYKKTILAFVLCYVLGVGSVQTAKATNKNQTYEQRSIKI